jgi:hypothetical protein
MGAIRTRNPCLISPKLVIYTLHLTILHELYQEEQGVSLVVEIRNAHDVLILKRQGDYI